MPQEVQKSGDLLGEEGGGTQCFPAFKLSLPGKLDSQMNFINLLGNCGKIKESIFSFCHSISSVKNMRKSIIALHSLGSQIVFELHLNAQNIQDIIETKRHPTSTP